MSREFFLGIHRPNWLDRPELDDVAVCVSREVYVDRRTRQYMKKWTPATGKRRRMIDSSAFSQLQKYGRWTITARQYIDFLVEQWERVGPFEAAGPMDWMAEPFVINGGTFRTVRFVGTGLSAVEHLRRTVDNYVELQSIAPRYIAERIFPTVQGFEPELYRLCCQMYRAVGVDLSKLPRVGVGSVCRRQNEDVAAQIVDTVAGEVQARNLHGFGFKISGIKLAGHQLRSTDSQAPSFDGRYAGPCQHPSQWRKWDPVTGQLRQPRSEANCLTYIAKWRTDHIVPLGWS